MRQSLQSLGTIESQVEGVGKLSERKVEEFAFETPPERVRKLLDVDQVLRVKRVNLADGEPFAVVTVWCPADLGANLSRDDVERRPFYELLAARVCAAPRRRSAPTSSTRPTPRCSACRSARRCCAANGSPPTGTGRTVLVSEHVFPAHRTEFVVELPQAEPSMTPSGLRIVD